MGDIGVKFECKSETKVNVQDVLKIHHEKIGYLLRKFSEFADDIVKMHQETKKENLELIELLKDLRELFKKEQNK